MKVTPVDSQRFIPEHERQNAVWLLFSFSLGHSAVALIAINNGSRLAGGFSLIAACLYSALALIANRTRSLPRLYQLVLSLMTLLVLTALLIFTRAMQHIPTSLFISCGMVAGLALTWLNVRQAVGWSLSVLVPVLGAGFWFPFADPATIALTGMMLMLIAYMRQYNRDFLQIQARQDQLKNLAERDPLTGLYNRRALLEQAQHRLSADTVLVLFDIDHFKQINDTHGHLYGDEILTYVAHCLREALPPETLLARWGGEEFLALFSGMPAWARDDVARALQRIEQTQFKNGVQITVSAGGALQPEAADLAALILLADRRLYAAKTAGRNCARWVEG